MDHLDAICFSCKRRHPDGNCPLASRRRQPVVDLLEATMIDPIDEIYAEVDRTGYFTGQQAVAVARRIREDLARSRRATA